MQKNDFESMNFEMFKEVVHNFGKSDNGMSNLIKKSWTVSNSRSLLFKIDITYPKNDLMTNEFIFWKDSTNF